MTTELTEKCSGKRRGRPKSKWLAAVSALWPEVTTKRSIDNRRSMLRAYKTLREHGDQNVRGYFDDPSRRRFRLTLLTALGRLQDDGNLIGTAEIICAEGMNPAQGVSLCRAIRVSEQEASWLEPEGNDGA